MRATPSQRVDEEQASPKQQVRSKVRGVANDKRENVNQSGTSTFASAPTYSHTRPGSCVGFTSLNGAVSFIRLGVHFLEIGVVVFHTKIGCILLGHKMGV